MYFFFFFQAEDGIRDGHVTGVQTCALPISPCGSVVELPEEETRRRKEATNPEWPIAHVVLHGVDRDQFMGRHKANHAQLVYADDADAADRALTAKAALFHRLGVTVHLCGDAVIVE